MDANLEKSMQLRIAGTIDSLKKNNIEAVFAPTRVEALALLKSLLKEGENIAIGGSVTLSEIGALDLIKDKKYNFVERNPEHLKVDTFLCSSNAITQNGYLYNVDGSGNRVSSIICGPDRVIIFAGYNKIVSDLREAVNRVKNIACPANAIRLGKDTYCAKHGKCIVTECNSSDFMFVASEKCPETICRTAVVTGPQKKTGRLLVVIIGEELGY